MLPLFLAEDRAWWQFWRKPPPEPEGLTIFGYPWEGVVQTIIFLAFLFLLLTSGRRFVRDVLVGMLGDAMAWIVAVTATILIVAAFIMFSEGVPVLLALGLAVIVMIIVLLSALFS